MSREGIKPDPENVEAVEKMKPPTNVKETRRFLGMAGFYRTHIEKLLDIAAPLTDLTRKNVPFVWDEACQRAVEAIKRQYWSKPTCRGRWW